MKLALAQINPTVGDIRGNARKIKLVTRSVDPKITNDRLGKTIAINLSTNRLTFYDGLKVRRVYPVATGQPTCFVGATGDARGCHVHFEVWSAPGWQSGGSAVDPLPSLRAWDDRTA